MSNTEENVAADKNKGSQKAWTTAEQREWLTAQLPSYRASRSGPLPRDIWPSIYEGWFEKWPLGEADASEMDISNEVRLKKKRAVSSLLLTSSETHCNS